MNKKLLLLFSGVLLISCQEKDDVSITPQLRFNISHESLTAEDKLQNVNAFMFDNQALVKKLTNMTPNSDGFYVIGTDRVNADKLLFIAGDHAIDFETKAMSYDELQALTVEKADFITSFPKLYYTGEKALSSIANATLELGLTRSVARLDVKKITQLEVVVDSCVVTNLADCSFVLPGNVESPTATEYKRQVIGTDVFAGIDAGVNGVAYLYESKGHAPQVTLYTRINGVKNRLNVTLPEVIERNKRYEIAINSNGAVLYADLQILPWGEGGSSVAKPENFVPKIDLENSNFPEGVAASANLDTLYISAGFEGVFTLGLDAPVETETKLESTHVSVRPIASPKNTYLGNRFELEVKKNDINRPDILVGMFVKSKTESQYYDKQIVIVKRGYRTRFEGLEASLLGNNAVYSEYTDGTLGRISVNGTAEVTAIETRSADSQFDWLQVAETEGRRSLEGGFRPNDREAVGQKQSSIVRVVFADGEVEEFLFTRMRNALPVVKLGGLYWAKYNMRGDSKSYKDQIGFDKDVDNLWEYLKTCSSDEYYFYAGAEYKGVSSSGMLLENKDGVLVYNNYTSIPEGNLATATADTHCPAGYKIPTKTELSQIIATQVALTLPQNGSNNHYTTPANGYRYRIDRFKRDSVLIDGVPVYNTAHIMLTDINRNESIVLNGIGHQYNGTQTSLGHWIIGLVESGGQYYGVNNAGNAMAMQSHNGAKTRIIRCIKSPVNYIVE